MKSSTFVRNGAVEQVKARKNGVAEQIPAGRNRVFEQWTAAGSYTVEASLLMGIVLAVLISVLYLGFYLHDVGFLQGAAHEAACAASLEADGESGNLSSRASSLISGRLLGIREGSLSVSAGTGEASVTGKGTLSLPGMTQMFFGKSSIAVRTQVTLTTERPTKRIQTLRGIAKIAKGIQGGGS